MDFIYVFSTVARDKLISLGYKLLMQDESRPVYVFLNSGEQKFTQKDFAFAITNTLTF